MLEHSPRNEEMLKEEQKEPEFMKYIKNMNVNMVSSNYVDGSSPKSKPQIDQVPQEYQGQTSSQLDCNIKRLETDMEAELMSIKMRYMTKINGMKQALEVMKV